MASPPPTAAPCTAAITGWGSSWIASISWARLSWMKWIAPTGPRSCGFGRRRVVAGHVGARAEAATAARDHDGPHRAVVAQVREHGAELADHRGRERVVAVGIVELDERDARRSPRSARDDGHGATDIRSAKPVGACTPMLACSNRPKPSAPSHVARATWSMLPNGMRGDDGGVGEVDDDRLRPRRHPSTGRGPSRRRRSPARGAAARTRGCRSRPSPGCPACRASAAWRAPGGASPSGRRCRTPASRAARPGRRPTPAWRR